MKKLLSLFLACILLLGILPTSVFAADSVEEALGEVNIYNGDYELGYWTSTTAQREMQSSSASGQGCFRLSTHLQPAGAVGSALTPKEKNCAISITTTQTCGNGCWSCRPCPTR